MTGRSYICIALPDCAVQPFEQKVFKMKAKNPSYLAVARVLDDAGIPHTRVPRGKHEAVQFSLDGVKTSVFLAVSSGDVRAPRAARALVRRMLRRQRPQSQPEA
jgi:hypothetical protein